MNKIEKIFVNYVQHYNHKKYWKYRKAVVDKDNKTNKLLKIYYLYRIKKMDAFNNASFGTHLNYGAYFYEPPKLPHGIRGIFISHNVKVGKNSTIFHHVTIGEENGGAPTIGDNCIIGAGAKIVGGIKIGNNVKIGAGCVVAADIPDNATVVMQKPRIIVKEN